MAITSATTSSGSFSNYLNTASSTFIQPGRTLTVMAWVRPSAIPAFDHYAVFLGSRPGASGSGWGLHLRGQGASTQPGWGMFFTNDDTNYDDAVMAGSGAGTGSGVVGQWDHVAWIIRTGATEDGYLNGNLRSLTMIANAGAIPAAASRGLQIKFGDGEANETLDGAIAYVRIFDGELGGAEIAVEMVSPRAANQRLPVLVDIPLEPDNTALIGWDYGPLRLHAATVTGTVTWCDPPPAVRQMPSVIAGIRRIGTGTTGGTTYTASLAGSVTPVGALAKQDAKPLAGTGTLAGALGRAAAKPLAGAATPAGALAKQSGKGLAGSAAPAGALTRAAATALAGALTATGALGKAVAKPLVGAVTPAGVLSTAKVILVSLTGAVASTGSLIQQAGKGLAGFVTSTGAVAKAAAKPITGGSTPAGAVGKQAGKALAGSTTPTGDLTRLVAKGLAGALTVASAVGKLIGKGLAGTGTLSGAESNVQTSGSTPVNATSVSAVTAARTSTPAVSARRTSTPGVTAANTSAPTTSDG